MRDITPQEMKRRQMVAEAKLKMTEAMGQVTEEIGELYYSEWLLILHELAGRLIGRMVEDDRKEAGK